MVININFLLAFCILLIFNCLNGVKPNYLMSCLGFYYSVPCHFLPGPWMVQIQRLRQHHDW